MKGGQGQITSRPWPDHLEAKVRLRSVDSEVKGGQGQITSRP